MQFNDASGNEFVAKSDQHIQHVKHIRKLKRVANEPNQIKTIYFFEYYLFRYLFLCSK